uniref:Tf2-1-like SH3-like domain-containing protein n=1 Tax=Cajanus cajan TaxID=3821 RepID=A0A151R9B7_CAJCA|nr:hypothetical protein KK1_039483 [Cajanus cajan]
MPYIWVWIPSLCGRVLGWHECHCQKQNREGCGQSGQYPHAGCWGVTDHVFLKVTPWTGEGRALKSRKLTPCFISPYQVLKRIGEVAYQIALPPSLSNLHNVFHVSQLRKYVHDPSHIIESDNIQLKDNLTYETVPLRIDDTRVKQLRGKEIPWLRSFGGEILKKVLHGN